MRLPKILKQFVLQNAIWTALCFVAEVFCHSVLHLYYPYSYPFIPPSSRFGDFRFYLTAFSHFHSPQFFVPDRPMMYPAPMGLCYKLFLWQRGPMVDPAFVTARFLGVVLVTSWIMLALLRRALIRRGLAPKSATLFLMAVYLLAFPFWFEVFCANLEFVIWVLVTLAIWAFWTERPWIAAICVGVAASMKIYPFVFLGIFLVRKQYRQAVCSLLVGGLTTLVSLWAICPDLRASWQGTSYGLNYFREHWILRLAPIETGFDHSLFCLLKRILYPLPPPQQLGHILNLYLAVVAVAGVVLFFTRIWKLPLINQILCLSIASILLPPTSYDYTLIHLYAPFALLLFVALERARRAPAEKADRGLIMAFALLAFLLSVQSEFIHRAVRFGGQLKCIALLLLWAVAMIYPFEANELPSPQGRSGSLPGPFAGEPAATLAGGQS